MGERAVDALAGAVQAVARGDLDAGERAVREAQSLNQMLDRVLTAVTRAPSGPSMRAWSAAAVLVARHIERVANNAAELGARVHFLVTGEIGGARGLTAARAPRPRGRASDPFSETSGGSYIRRRRGRGISRVVEGRPTLFATARLTN